MQIEYEMFGNDGDFSGSARPAHHNLSCCPFCLSTDVVVSNTWTPSYWVECNECGAHGPHVMLTEKMSFATLGAAKREHRRACIAAIKAWDERL